MAYASKAFLCGAMARLAHEEGMYLDVATGGELFVARHAGVPGDRLVMHGNNKSDRELAMAVEEGVGRIVVDSFDELDRLDALAAATGVRPRVLLRITPGVEAHTHEFVATGQDDSKFGFTVSSGLAAAAVERAAAAGSVELVGLHAHIGSQVFEVGAFSRAVEVLAGFAAPFGLPELSVGGGLGVPYVEGESAPSLTEWAAGIHQVCDAAGVAARVSAEPGRAIVAAAAVTLYRVGTVKDLPGIRTYVAVDGGMSDNPRPVLYGSGYETLLPRAANAERPRAVRVVGKHCESGDLLVREGWVPRRPGGGRCAGHAGHRRLWPCHGFQLQPRAATCCGVRGRWRRPRGGAPRVVRRSRGPRGRRGGSRGIRVLTGPSGPVRSSP